MAGPLRIGGNARLRPVPAVCDRFIVCQPNALSARPSGIISMPSACLLGQELVRDRPVEQNDEGLSTDNPRRDSFRSGPLVWNRVPYWT
jgi:hypothetical protein